MKVIPFNKKKSSNLLKPDPDVIDSLKDLLEMAKSGELNGFVIIMSHPGDSSSWGWVGRITRSLIGSVELCKFDLCQKELENIEE